MEFLSAADSKTLCGRSSSFRYVTPRKYESGQLIREMEKEACCLNDKVVFCIRTLAVLGASVAKWLAHLPFTSIRS
jgi:hypothetical protein